MSSKFTLRHRIFEFFTLGELRSGAQTGADQDRVKFEHALLLAFQRREAAEKLWKHGYCAESLRLARESLEGVASELGAFAAKTVPTAGWVLRAQAVAAAAENALAGRARPELDAEVQPEDGETFRMLDGALTDLEAEIGPGASDPAKIARVGRQRLMNAALLVAVVALVIAWWRRAPDVLAHASSQLRDDAPDRALDWNPRTSWSTPDDQKGWFELVLPHPRAVSGLRIIPYNFGYQNRFTREVHVTAYLRDMAVKSMDFTFPQPASAAEPVWFDMPLDAPPCDRVRLDVTTYSGISASIAEIELR